MIFSPPKTWPAWKLWCASNQVLCTYAEAVEYFDKVRAERAAAKVVNDKPKRTGKKSVKSKHSA